MDHVLAKWQAHEHEHRPKDAQWYWVVGIIAVGVAVAAVIMQDYLFAVIAVIAGFTLMLVGSARPPRHTYSLTETGFMVGKDLIPFDKITRFAISEDEPRYLTLESLTLIGYVRAPLEGADYRAIRMELKNRNIEEKDNLDSFVHRLARGMGL
jgi:hypothetical protein